MSSTIEKLKAIVPLLQKRTTSIAAIAVLTVILRFLFASKRRKVTHVTDFNSIAKQVAGSSTSHGHPSDQYDFIIIGGGTAGAVLASRLSEDRNIRVLLLEAGASSKDVAASQVPASFSELFQTVHDWGIVTAPQVNMNNLRVRWPRGKLLGGCSSINAMIAHYSSPSDYDEWAQLQNGQEGAEQWAYDSLRKSFDKFEKYTPSAKFPGVNASLRSKLGLVNVGHFGYMSEGAKKFIDACVNVGFARLPDLNTAKGTLGVAQTMTYIGSNGRRSSTEVAYLTPEVLARSNLKVAIGAHVTRVLFDTSRSIPRATGVEFMNNDGEKFTVHAQKEVILSAGAIHTPHILQLSGIGSAEHLAQHGIPVVADLPGVGLHLMDHAVLDFRFVDKNTSLSFFRNDTISQKLRVLKAIWEYMTFKSGPLTSNIAETLAFARSTDPKLFPVNEFPPNEIEVDTTSDSSAPDIELFYSNIGYTANREPKTLMPVGINTAGLHAVLLRPLSTGIVRLQSANPLDPPIVDPKYLSHHRDMVVLMRGSRLISRIIRTEPMKSTLDLTGATHPIFKQDYALGTMSDTELESVIRERLDTLFHPTSTARMAPLEDGGVVDTYLRVRGVENLRIVDASIFPTIPSGHTNGPVIAVAEKAADIIKATYAKA